MIPALDEAIRIGREAGIPVEIWHIKAAGKPNWGRMPDIVAKIEAARTSGVDIAANTYAYTAGSIRCRRSSRRGPTTVATRR